MAQKQIMAFDGNEQQDIGDDSLLPALGSEAESDFQTLFAAYSNPADPSHDLDLMFSHSTLSTVLTDPENGCSYLDTSFHSTSAFESSHRPKLGYNSSFFPRDTVDILKQWLEKHSENPYPTKNEKASLARKTGLTVAQVSSWFANTRRRYKHGSFGNTPSEPGPIESLSESQRISREEWPLMNPLDRWENSPPEVEPAPLEAIMNAVARSEKDGLYKRSCEPAPTTANNGNKGISRTSNDAQSIAPSNKSRSAVSSSSNSSAYSFTSSISQGSFGCFYLDESPRRRRRRRQKTNKSTTAHKRIFQCTFCTDTFRTKHDWTRHEKTLHLSLESFTCAPFGSVYKGSTDGVDHCVFCDEPYPTKTHTETHRFMSCQQKPSAFRTFYRKDHLVQHLRLLHGVEQAIPITETWKSQVEHINSRCGFCEQKFTVWSERNNHIAGHFRDGTLMKNWQGCRGLDPPVALAVENAMPPYLIGVESAGMNPFSASQLIDNERNLSSTTPDACQIPTTRQTPTSFEYLTASLTNFVQQMNTTGHVVTDEMLQKEARRIVFCDDDPWNQTPADNAEWLKLFKEGVGLDQGTEIQTEISQSPEIQDYSEYNFCLPWSADHWTPTGSHPTTDLLDINSASMAWSWQSPECLAEFRRNLQALSADPSSGICPGFEP